MKPKNMFGRFFKNKEDGKSGPPGHQRQGGQNGGANEPPAGGGFFNLPPPVSKPYGGHNAAGSSVPSNSGPAAGGYPPPPAYGNSNAPPDNNSMGGRGPSGGGTDMFGGMSVKAPPTAATSGNKGAARRHSQPQIQQPYGGPPQPTGAMQLPKASGSLFSGLEVAPGASPPMVKDDGGGLALPTYNNEQQRKATRNTGSFNYLDVAGAKNVDALGASQYSRTSATSSTGTTTSRSSSRAVKKKKKKTFRPGFGRQLSDESAAALQRGDLKEDDIIQQHEVRPVPDRSDSLRSSRTVTGPTDLAHLLPPVKSVSVLQGLTVHKGNATTGGGVLAGLTVHKPASPSPSPVKASRPAESEPSGNGVLSGLNIQSEPSGNGVLSGLNIQSEPSGNGVLSGLNIHNIPSSIANDDTNKPINDAPVEEPAPKVYKKPPSPVPASPATPEERLLNTLRDFHQSAVKFRELTVKQNEEENRLMERKAQLASQLTQHEMDLRDIEAQQHHACEVEDFEKADALNATINSVRHCITLAESDVRKLDSELVAFVKAKEKAFANQLKSTRGTLRELEKFHEDQESERTVVRNEYKLYEINQTEQLQFEAERIDTEMHHVSVSLENVISEKSDIEATIEGQCSSEFAVQRKLIEEKQAVEEEVRELERKLKEKQERIRRIQSSIDTAQRDINTVRKRYSRQLKRIADRETSIKNTKAEVESDGEHLAQQRQIFHDKLKQFADDISIIGKRIGAVKKEMRAASLLANVLEVQETRREQSLLRKKQQTAELSSLNDAAAVAQQSFTMLSKQHVELEKSLLVHRNAIASAEAMIPRLEQEKKTAAAQRNFKEAARISKDIKALEKDRSTAEEMVEVVEMELQDLKERIGKREAEFEEKKKELKEMEKHLELATLQELWKEAKQLRTALRKIERCKSEGDAANDGIDFRSSALLLIQAEYDACFLQVESLEKKYGVTDPAKDEDVEDDDDESVDNEEKESNEHVPRSRSSLAGKGTDVEGSDTAAETLEDSNSVLEEIVAQLLELESQIEKATENEEYELAARLDEKIEALKQRQQAIEASIAQEVSDGGNEDESFSEDDAEESNSREDSAEEAETDEEYAHEEMVSPMSGVRSHGELTKSLETVQRQVAKLEKKIELATEEENYDIAASYDDEMQALREQVKTIRAQLDSVNGSNDVMATTMSDNPTSIEAEVSDVPMQPLEVAVVESTAGESLFGGLQISGGPGATSANSAEVPIPDPDLVVKDEALKADEAAAHAKAEIVSPTCSEMKDSFFGNPDAPDSSFSPGAPSASGFLSEGLQMSGNFQASASSLSLPPHEKTEENEEDKQISDVTTSQDVDLSAPDNENMFSGLRLSSSAVNADTDAPVDDTCVPTKDSVDKLGDSQSSDSAVADATTASVDHVSTDPQGSLFGGLKLSDSSAGATVAEHTSVEVSANTLAGVEVSSSAADASTEAPTNLFGGLELSSNAVTATPAEGGADAASFAEESDSSAKSAGDTRMSICELSEHSESSGANDDTSDAPTAASAVVSSEISSTETTTTVTQVTDGDEIVTESEQDATPP